MKPKIKIKFTDFWPGFDKSNNFFTKLLELQYDIEISNDPDFLFYSCFGWDFLNYDCVRIFYTCEDVVPDFNLCDYAIGFNYLSFGNRYIRYPLYLLYFEDYMLAKEKHLIDENEIEKKILFCNFLYSNGSAHPNRELFYDLLTKYKTVDSGGGFRNNLGFRVENKLEFQKKYKFSIAFENATSEGYTTEKIIQAFAAQTIPIYWGNPSVFKEFNSNAFINCHDFSSFDDVVRRIEEIDNDPKLFFKILKEPIYLENIDRKKVEEPLLNFLCSIFNSRNDLVLKRSRVARGYYYEQRMKQFQQYQEYFEIHSREPSNLLNKVVNIIKTKVQKLNENNV